MATKAQNCGDQKQYRGIYRGLYVISEIRLRGVLGCYPGVIPLFPAKILSESQSHDPLMYMSNPI